MAYNHIELEQKWQKFWEENQVFKTENPTNTNTYTNTVEKNIVSETNKDSNVSVSSVCVPSSVKQKKYILDMFPYPSGAGLHVGHPKGYTATDIVSRYYHARGFNVLHTMGWDAFGLPAENYAIKTGTHPAKTTAANIAVFKEQLHSLGFSYDWSREIDTTDPKYYQWTQWIFLELFKKGLAYEQDLPINYCPSCKTGLANEEVLSDNTCDRCGTLVERRPIRQWVLKITEYADRLIEDLDGLDWPEGVKEMQRNWIGKSEGCEFRMLKDEGFRYSRATSDDFNKILEIRKETGFHTVDFSQEQFFVAKKNGEIAGFIRTQKYGEYTELGALYVGEDFRGDKLGYKLISYAIEHTDTSEFYMDCIKELQGYYEKFGFTILNAPKDFQIEKLKKVWDFYGKNYTEQDILDITLFMSIKKDSIFPKLPSIEVYTTRVDTVYGMTYAVLAPDHPRVYDFITDEQSADCEAYITEAASRSDQDRTNEGKEKTGVFTGSYVINPFNGESVPLWIADYVLGHYGTGAVMAVPAHDERDFAFAKRYGLSIKPVIAFKDIKLEENFYTEDEMIIKDGELYFLPLEFKSPRVLDGLLHKSGEYSGLTSAEARRVLSEKAESEGFGRKKVNYKLRDWLFSRQRYWGEPIPLIHISNEDYEGLPVATANKEKLIEFPETGIFQFKKEGDGECYIPKKTGEAFVIKYGSNYKGSKTGEEYLMIATEVEGTNYTAKEFSKIYDGINGKIVIDSNLPLTLPEVEKYEPAGDGQSPLATVPSFVNVQIANNLNGKRETNTMPQWGGSCWYYLRYMDPTNSDALASKEALEYWQNVDEYVGGAEHAVLHLLYARFWHKVLYDIGVVPTKEPFQKLVNQGMILAYAYERQDGGLVAVDLVEEVPAPLGRGDKGGSISETENPQSLRDSSLLNGASRTIFIETSTGKEVKQVVAKMSKSLKNVVNPNDIVREHGADTLRLYEMSMGAFTDTAPWNPEAIIGVRRFLDKAHATFTEGKNLAKDDMKAMKLLHKTVKKVGEDIVEYKFNTAIAALQILLNEGLPRDAEFAREWKEKFATILHPFAPHMAEELWQTVHSAQYTQKSDKKEKDSDVCTVNCAPSTMQSVYFASWPEYEEFMLVDDEVTIAVQVGGKLRGTFTFLNGVGQEEVSAVVRADEGIKKWIEGKEIVKEIFIPNKMLSIVIKG